MIIDNAIRSMSENLQKLGDLQSQASSGKRFEKNSDAPRASRAALALRSNLKANKSYLESVNAAEGWLNASAAVLGQLEDLATKVINLSLQGISDPHSEARTLLANQIDDMLTDAIAAGNTQHQNSYLFAGHQVDTAPFRFLSGSPDSVVYDGDSAVIQRTIGPDQSAVINFDADAVFSPLYTAMIAARDALLADDVPALQTAVSDLQAAHDQLKHQQAVNGLRIGQLEDSRSYLEETQLAIQDLLSKEEDIDLVEVITELRHQETVYQAALQVGRRTMATMNLFDLMK
jgi:flagellar hook-associated protein 3 FlgL